ncbi:MAG: L-rhamnose/proton symporter RhaT [Opitutales bacterium]
MVFLGVVLHGIGGLAAGSFYLPLKRVKDWSWESAWLVNGIFSWILMPTLVALLTVPTLFSVIGGTAATTLFWTYGLGVLWGIGGLTFGLSVRYLGMSLGYAVALGFCAAFGTLIPTLVDGTIRQLLSSTSGWVVLSGIAVCLLGIGVCGYAGHLKERALSAEKIAQQEFKLLQGLLVAGFAGIMSACMAFAFAAGALIAEQAEAGGTQPLWVNNPVLVVILLGGFTTNALWCVYLNWKKGTWKDYGNKSAPRLQNTFFASLAGITWYLQFMFYGMGSTKMGDYHFTSWTLHMSFIIITSNLWSLLLREWKGSGRKPIGILIAGIVIITLSTVLIGWGNYLQGLEAAH